MKVMSIHPPLKSSLTSNTKIGVQKLALSSSTMEERRQIELDAFYSDIAKCTSRVAERIHAVDDISLAVDEENREESPELQFLSDQSLRVEASNRLMYLSGKLHTKDIGDELSSTQAWIKSVVKSYPQQLKDCDNQQPIKKKLDVGRPEEVDGIAMVDNDAVAIDETFTLELKSNAETMYNEFVKKCQRVQDIHEQNAVVQIAHERSAVAKLTADMKKRIKTAHVHLAQTKQQIEELSAKELNDGKDFIRKAVAEKYQPTMVHLNQQLNNKQERTNSVQAETACVDEACAEAQRLVEELEKLMASTLPEDSYVDAKVTAVRRESLLFLTRPRTRPNTTASNGRTDSSNSGGGGGDAMVLSVESMLEEQESLQSRLNMFVEQNKALDAKTSAHHDSTAKEKEELKSAAKVLRDKAAEIESQAQQWDKKLQALLKKQSKLLKKKDGKSVTMAQGLDSRNDNVKHESNSSSYLVSDAHASSGTSSPIMSRKPSSPARILSSNSEVSDNYLEREMSRERTDQLGVCSEFDNEAASDDVRQSADDLLRISMNVTGRQALTQKVPNKEPPLPNWFVNERDNQPKFTDSYSNNEINSSKRNAVREVVDYALQAAQHNGTTNRATSSRSSGLRGSSMNAPDDDLDISSNATNSMKNRLLDSAMNMTVAPPEILWPNPTLTVATSSRQLEHDNNEEREEDRHADIGERKFFNLSGESAVVDTANESGSLHMSDSNYSGGADSTNVTRRRGPREKKCSMRIDLDGNIAPESLDGVKNTMSGIQVDIGKIAKQYSTKPSQRVHLMHNSGLGASESSMCSVDLTVKSVHSCICAACYRVYATQYHSEMHPKGGNKRKSVASFASKNSGIKGRRASVSLAGGHRAANVEDIPLSFNTLESVDVIQRCVNSLVASECLHRSFAAKCLTDVADLLMESRVPNQDERVCRLMRSLCLDIVQNLLESAPKLLLVRNQSALFSSVLSDMLCLMGVILHSTRPDWDSEAVARVDIDAQILEMYSLKIVQQVVNSDTIGEAKDINNATSNEAVAPPGQAKFKKKVKGATQEDDDAVKKNKAVFRNSMSFVTQLRTVMEQLCGQIVDNGTKIYYTLNNTINSVLNSTVNPKKSSTNSLEVDNNNNFSMKHRHAILGFQLMLLFVTNKHEYSASVMLSLMDRGIHQGNTAGKLVKTNGIEDLPVIPTHDIETLASQVCPQILPAILALDLYRRVLEEELARMDFLSKIVRNEAEFGDLQFLNVTLPLSIDMAINAQMKHNRLSITPFASIMTQQDSLSASTQADGMEASTTTHINEKLLNSEGEVCSSVEEVEASVRALANSRDVVASIENVPEPPHDIKNLHREWLDNMTRLLIEKCDEITILLWGSVEDVDPEKLGLFRCRNGMSYLPLTDLLKSQLWYHINRLKEYSLRKVLNESRLQVAQLTLEFDSYAREFVTVRYEVLEKLQMFAKPWKVKLEWLTLQCNHLYAEFEDLLDDYQNSRVTVVAAQKIIADLTAGMQEFQSQATIPDFISKKLEDMLYKHDHRDENLKYEIGRHLKTLNMLKMEYESMQSKDQFILAAAMVAEMDDTPHHKHSHHHCRNTRAGSTLIPQRSVNNSTANVPKMTVDDFVLPSTVMTKPAVSNTALAKTGKEYLEAKNQLAREQHLQSDLYQQAEKSRAIVAAISRPAASNESDKRQNTDGIIYGSNDNYNNNNNLSTMEIYDNSSLSSNNYSLNENNNRNDSINSRNSNKSDKPDRISAAAVLGGLLDVEDSMSTSDAINYRSSTSLVEDSKIDIVQIDDESRQLSRHSEKAMMASAEDQSPQHSRPATGDKFRVINALAQSFKWFEKRPPSGPMRSMAVVVEAAMSNIDMIFGNRLVASPPSVVNSHESTLNESTLNERESSVAAVTAANNMAAPDNSSSLHARLQSFRPSQLQSHQSLISDSTADLCSEPADSSRYSRQREGLHIGPKITTALPFLERQSSKRQAAQQQKTRSEMYTHLYNSIMANGMRQLADLTYVGGSELMLDTIRSQEPSVSLREREALEDPWSVIDEFYKKKVAVRSTLDACAKYKFDNDEDKLEEVMKKYQEQSIANSFSKVERPELKINTPKFAAVSGILNTLKKFGKKLLRSKQSKLSECTINETVSAASLVSLAAFGPDMPVLPMQVKVSCKPSETPVNDTRLVIDTVHHVKSLQTSGQESLIKSNSVVSVASAMETVEDVEDMTFVDLAAYEELKGVVGMDSSSLITDVPLVNSSSQQLSVSLQLPRARSDSGCGDSNSSRDPRSRGTPGLSAAAPYQGGLNIAMTSAAIQRENAKRIQSPGGSGQRRSNPSSRGSRARIGSGDDGGNLASLQAAAAAVFDMGNNKHIPSALLPQLQSCTSSQWTDSLFELPSVTDSIQLNSKHRSLTDNNSTGLAAVTGSTAARTSHQSQMQNISQSSAFPLDSLSVTSSIGSSTHHSGTRADVHVLAMPAMPKPSHLTLSPRIKSSRHLT